MNSPLLRGRVLHNEKTKTSSLRQMRGARQQYRTKKRKPAPMQNVGGGHHAAAVIPTIIVVLLPLPIVNATPRAVACGSGLGCCGGGGRHHPHRPLTIVVVTQWGGAGLSLSLLSVVVVSVVSVPSLSL